MQLGHDVRLNIEGLMGVEVRVESLHESDAKRVGTIVGGYLGANGPRLLLVRENGQEIEDVGLATHRMYVV